MFRGRPSGPTLGTDSGTVQPAKLTCRHAGALSPYPFLEAGPTLLFVIPGQIITLAEIDLGDDYRSRDVAVAGMARRRSVDDPAVVRVGSHTYRLDVTAALHPPNYLQSQQLELLCGLQFFFHSFELSLQVNATVADDFDAPVAALDPVASYRQCFLTFCDRH